MNTLDQVMGVLSGLLHMVVAGSLLFAPTVLDSFSSLSPWDRGILVLILALFGLYQVLRNVRRVKVRSLVHTTELGAVRISFASVKGLIESCALEEAGVKEAMAKLIDGDPFSVLLEIRLASDVNIPELAATLQTRVSSHLKETVGLIPKTIQVNVKEISEGKNARVE